MTDADTGLDAAIWIAIVLAIFAIVLGSVGGVLRRAPAESTTGRTGNSLLLIGLALGATAIILAVAGLAGVV